jgi:hypothetical protein
MNVDQKVDADSINKETLTVSFRDQQHTLLTRKNSGPANAATVEFFLVVHTFCIGAEVQHQDQLHKKA